MIKITHKDYRQLMRNKVNAGNLGSSRINPVQYSLSLSLFRNVQNYRKRMKDFISRKGESFGDVWYAKGLKSSAILPFKAELKRV